MTVAFLEETEVCKRAVRRLARSRNADVTLQGGTWVYSGVELDGDEIWSVLSTMPATNNTRYGP